MGEDDKINTSITDRMTLISQSVCEKIIAPCAEREKEKYISLKDEVDTLKTTIVTGLEKVQSSIEKIQEKRSSTILSWAQLFVSLILSGVIVWKWH